MDIKKILSSRTVWVVIVLFLINGVQGIRELLPANLLPVIDAILGIAAVYFRIQPKIGSFKKES